MTRNEILIDPPEGWRYGFPKPCPEFHDLKFNLNEWLLANGYPEENLKWGQVRVIGLTPWDRRQMDLRRGCQENLSQAMEQALELWTKSTSSETAAVWEGVHKQIRKLLEVM
jgi:hypothetical protein